MSVANHRFRRSPLGALCVGLCVVAGCGDSHGLVSVRGRVTFGGGDPPVPGVLYFVPDGPPATGADTRTTPRAGSASFGTDGRFRAMTFRDGDGLRPGTYEVRVECKTAPPNADRNPRGWRDHVPAGFVAPALEVPAKGGKGVIYDLDVAKEGR